MTVRLQEDVARVYKDISPFREGFMQKKYRSDGPPLDSQDTDILVLGSGLAGLRAALSATISYPEARVTLVSAQEGPSGSSFANPNNALGMQVCRTEEEQAALIREILELAPPGQADPRLVILMAEESESRFKDLQDIGVRFSRLPGPAGDGAPGCFSPGSRRAALVDNLARVFTCFRQRLDGLGVRWLPGWLVAALPATPGDGRVRGALLFSPDGRAMAVRAGATILAIGGPAPLFARHLAGPGTPGYSLGLLHRTGVGLVNAGFLQFFWSVVPGRAFFPMEAAFAADFSVETATGVARPLLGYAEETLIPLRASRAGHCPCAYGRPDALLDVALASLTDGDGIVTLGQGNGPLRVALYAQAGNGGAAIDPMGHTGVPGLFAAGECAGGMHGANRLGGAMVTATQVFGARAGLAAAMEACLGELLPEKAFRDLAAHTLAALPRHPASRVEGLDWLGRELSRQAGPIPGPGLGALAQILQEQLEHSTDWMLDLCRETALVIVRAQRGTTDLSSSQAA